MIQAVRKANNLHVYNLFKQPVNYLQVSKSASKHAPRRIAIFTYKSTEIHGLV